MGISFNRPDGVNPGNNSGINKAKIKDSFALKAFKPLFKFGNKQEISDIQAYCTNFETRHSQNIVCEFNKVIQKYEDVEFKQYQNNIPILEIGEDFMEDIALQETCEV